MRLQPPWTLRRIIDESPVSLSSAPLYSLDINECRHYPGRLCAHKCENTEGSYQCSCTTGFKLEHDGRNCEGKMTICSVFSFDICRWWALRKCKQARKEHFAGVLTDVNECDNNPCSQECANVYGSYQCYCRRGYQLSDLDGITCEGSVELHSLWVLAINGFRLRSPSLSASPQTLMSALCLPEVTCAPTAAPTPRGVSTVPARPQATPSAPMDVHAKVGGSNCRNSA